MCIACATGSGLSLYVVLCFHSQRARNTTTTTTATTVVTKHTDSDSTHERRAQFHTIIILNTINWASPRIHSPFELTFFDFWICLGNQRSIYICMLSSEPHTTYTAIARGISTLITHIRSFFLSPSLSLSITISVSFSLSCFSLNDRSRWAGSREIKYKKSPD